MRTQIIILALLVLFNVGSAGTYQLGSHNVSLNLSVSAVYSIETPMSPGRGSHVTDGKPHIVIRSR